jgi:SulP family sulfate permease
MSKRTAQLGDLWGGVAAAAVILPQAMAFGVALLAPAGVEASRGALTGLIGAAVLSAVAGVVGGTRGLISAPTGPVLVLITGALATLTGAAYGVDPFIALTALLLLTGLFQIGIGFTGGGNLIKYIPYPVVSGFMTGSALLMIKSQLTPLTPGDLGESWQLWRWIPLVVAATTFAVMYFVPRWLRNLPGTIAGLVGGTLVFHLLMLLAPGEAPATWMLGALPSIGSLGLDLSLTGVSSLPWIFLITSALALAVLASLDTLLTAVIADVSTGTRHSSRRELIGQGLGQMVSGLFGGMGGAGTTGATVIAIKSGGRRWVAVAAGVTIVALIAAGSTVGGLLPIAVLAGIIVYIAVGMIERDIVAWIKHTDTRLDAVIAILVTLITVVYDLMAAVGVGVAIAIILFIRAQIKAPVIHRRSTAAQLRSHHFRTTEERELLDQHGDRIVVYELRGNLFFATADRLLEELAPDLDRPAWLILHLRRVSQVDLTGLKFLQQIAERLHRHGGQLIFCNVHKGIGLGHHVDQALRNITAAMERFKVPTFNDSDEALEYAENSLLAELGAKPARRSDLVPLAQADLCRNMSASAIAALQEAVSEVDLPAGEKLFSAGDPGDKLYVLLQGEIDTRLPTTQHHYKRLEKYGPGSAFGELAFIEKGPRSAEAVAVFDSKLLVLDRDGFKKLKDQYPEAAIEFLLELNRIQVRHQRWSVSEIRRLAEW